MEEHDAIIVGGGIGGLSLGYRLAADGCRVCVLEARSEVKPSKRGVTLQPNGLEALENLGLLDKFIRIGAKIRGVAWYEVGGKLLARLDWSILDHPHNYLLTVVPSEVELLLRDEFLGKGGELHDSTSFLNLKIDSGEVRVKARERDGSVEYVGRVLVGADGENSMVREALRIPRRIREYNDHFILMRVPQVSAPVRGGKTVSSSREDGGVFPGPR